MPVFGQAQKSWMKPQRVDTAIFYKAQVARGIVIVIHSCTHLNFTVYVPLCSLFWPTFMLESTTDAACCCLYLKPVAWGNYHLIKI